MKTEKITQPRGNVLFLILIAVALFAALSYAVTQSSNTDEATPGKPSEAGPVNTSPLTQYPDTLRSAVLKMIVGGVDPVDMLFNKPDQFGTEGFSAFDTAHTDKGVFHQAGGQAVYQAVPAALSASGQPIDWTFNIDFEIPLIGLSTPQSLAGNDLIAFASGISPQMCARVNQELYNDPTVPVVNTAVNVGGNRIATTALPTVPVTETVLASSTPTTTWFNEKTRGCFQNGAATGSPNVFFSVLAER